MMWRTRGMLLMGPAFLQGERRCSRIVMVVAQLYKYAKKTIELHSLNRCILWSVNYILMKLLLKAQP